MKSLRIIRLLATLTTLIVIASPASAYAAKPSDHKPGSGGGGTTAIETGNDVS